MTLDEVMESLRAEGNENTARIYGRHGVRGPTLGVPYAALGRLAKKVKVDHDLAFALWDTGIHDARVLATRVAAPERMTAVDFERWLSDCHDYVLNDAISLLASRSPEAAKLAEAWVAREKDEWRSAAGWNVYALLATQGALELPDARPLLERVRRGIGGAPNRTRHSMNGALIAIGGAMEPLRAEAVAAAEAVGPVTVDHGQTGCKTPDAAAYIRKMAARRSARSKR